MPKRKHAAIDDDAGGDAAIIYADDSASAHYALVTKVEEALGSAANQDQVYTRMDAALVRWYRQIDVRNPGPLNATANASGFSMVDITMAAQAYDAFSQQLFNNAGQRLWDNSWW